MSGAFAKPGAALPPDLREGSAFPEGPALHLPPEPPAALPSELLKGSAFPASSAPRSEQKKEEGGSAALGKAEPFRKSARQSRQVFAHGARAVPVDLGYALWAATYDREPNPLLALEERVLEPGLPDVGGRTVLDVGCGTGRWLIRLLRRGPRRGVGIDLSTEMLRCAASRCLQGGWLARADALALPLRPKSVDLVICSFTLGHIDDLSGLAGELARVARQGADVYLSGLHPEARARGWRCAFRHGVETVEILEFHQPLEAVPGLFAAAGFKLVNLLEPHLGSDERPIFVNAGKADQFEAATSVPAIFVCHFRM